MHDYAEHVETSTNEAMRILQGLAAELVVAQVVEDVAEKSLTKAQEARRYLSERRLPEALEAAGFKAGDDLPYNIKLEKVVVASVPEERKAEAYQWLDDHGHGGMIKTLVAVSFGKGDAQKAKDLAARLGEVYDGVENVQSVHHSTLRAWVKARLEEGSEFPMELFGADSIERAKVVK